MDLYFSHQKVSLLVTFLAPNRTQILILPLSPSTQKQPNLLKGLKAIQGSTFYPSRWSFTNFTSGNIQTVMTALRGLSTPDTLSYDKRE